MFAIPDFTKITVYQLRHGRFVPTREFYQWNVPRLEDTDTDIPLSGPRAKGRAESSRMPCPGCGRVLPRAAIRETHPCTGELMPEPARNDRYLRNRNWDPAQGEPDPEGCPLPDVMDRRMLYNLKTNAEARAKRLIKRLTNPGARPQGRPRKSREDPIGQIYK